MALIFVTLMTAVLVLTLPALLADRQLFAMDTTLTLEFFDQYDDRIDQIAEVLQTMLPRGSTFQVFEAEVDEQGPVKQAVRLEITYSTPLGFFHHHSISSRILSSLEPPAQLRSLQLETTSVRGPPLIVMTVWLHLAAIPWLIIRLWWMPRNAVPARPLWPKRSDTTRLLALSAAAGLVIAILVELVFIAGEVLGLLEFSDNMPTLDTFGIDRDSLLLGALLVAVAGAVEEVVFRGVLLRRFVQNGLPVFGVFVCAFWFTLIHFPAFSWASGNLAYAALLALIGLGLGFLTLRTGTWLPAAIFHAAYNLTITLLVGMLSY